MTQDRLQAEYGVLLALTGPILLERAKQYREMAALLGPGAAATWLGSQAERAEQSIITIGEKFNDTHG